MPRGGAPILDALVKLHVASPSGGDDAPRMTQASATHEAATNKLLYWPHVLLPPAVTLVFVLHQCLVEPERASA
jgi:hypothetical protein